MQQSNVRTVFFFGLLLSVLALCATIFSPYMITLSVAATFAVVLQPLYKALRKIVRNIDSLAAILTILITGLLLLAPMSLIGTQIVQEARHLYEQIDENQEQITQNPIRVIEDFIETYIPQANIDLDQYVGAAVSWVAGSIGIVFAGTLNTILHFFLGIVAFFYFLKDGGKFVKHLINISPLADKEDVSIIARLEVSINSIVKGNLLIALIQGISSGIGMTIFGVPSAVLWGSLAALGALIPGVGTAIVLAPAILYLFATGSIASAVGLLIWAIVAVGLVDNFLGPIFVGRGVRIHPMFVLFAVLGGIQLFGPVGILLGPLSISLLHALLDIYKNIMMRKA